MCRPSAASSWVDQLILHHVFLSEVQTLTTCNKKQVFNFAVGFEKRWSGEHKKRLQSLKICGKNRVQDQWPMQWPMTMTNLGRYDFGLFLNFITGKQGLLCDTETWMYGYIRDYGDRVETPHGTTIGCEKSSNGLKKRIFLLLSTLLR